MDENQMKNMESNLTEEVDSIQRRKKNLSYQMKLVHRERSDQKEVLKEKNKEINTLRNRVAELKKLFNEEIKKKINAIQSAVRAQEKLDKTEEAVRQAYGNAGYNKVKTYRNNL